MIIRTIALMLGLSLPVGLIACGSGGSDPSPPPGPFVVASKSSSGAGFGVASDGTTFLVAYSALGQRDHADIVGLRLSDRGEPLDPSLLAISDAQSDPFLVAATADYSGAAVAYDGVQYGVSFFGYGDTDACSDCGQEVAFTPVSTTGKVLAKPTLIATETSFSMVASSLRLPVPVSGADGDFTTLYVSASGGIEAPFSTIDGAVVSYRAGAIATRTIDNLVPDAGFSDQSITTAWAPSVGAGRGGALGAWLESRSRLGTGASETYLEGAWLTPDGAANRVRLAALGSDASFGQPSPNIPSLGTAVATSGDDFLIVWGTKPDSENLPTELRGLRYRRDTGPLGPDGGFVIAGGSSGKSLGGAAIAGGRALVVWSEDGAVHGGYVEADGSPGDPFLIDEGPAAAATAVASNGEYSLVLFARPEPQGASSIHGRFLD